MPKFRVLILPIRSNTDEEWRNSMSSRPGFYHSIYHSIKHLQELNWLMLIKDQKKAKNYEKQN